MNLSAKQRKWAIGLACAAVATIIITWGARQTVNPTQTRSEVGQTILPNLNERRDEISTIEVVTKEETYTLVRNDEQWVMPSKSDVPVDTTDVATFVQALATMTYQRAMTRDDRKFDRIGLGHPDNGGTAAHVRLLDEGEGVLADLLIGYRAGTTYIRESDDLQSWAVTADKMPPLQRAIQWLDIDPDSPPIEDIVEVEVSLPGQPSYRVRPISKPRPPPTTFALAPPHQDINVKTQFLINSVARAASAYFPTDVTPASQIDDQAQYAGTHFTRYDSGFVLVVEAYRVNNQNWIKVHADTLDGATLGAKRQAASINAKMQGWAYAISNTDWEAFTLPLSAMAQ